MFFIKLHLLSLDVWGIKDAHKVGIIEDYLNSLTPKVDVLYLQEDKLRGDIVDRTSKKLWRSNFNH